MATEGWKADWETRVLLTLVTGGITLQCIDNATAKKYLAKHAGKKGKKSDEPREEVEEIQKIGWKRIINPMVFLAFFIGFAVYLCDGKNFALKSDNFLSRENAYLATVILYFATILPDWLKKELKGWTKWVGFFVNLIQLGLALTGLSVIAGNYVIKHSNGAVPWAISSWVIMAAWKLVIVIFHLFPDLYDQVADYE